MALPGIKTKGENGSPRFTIAFSLPMLVGASLVLVCAVAWAFYMGVMVGKGHNPQTRINDMTGGLLGDNKEMAAQPPLQSPPVQAEVAETSTPANEISTTNSQELVQRKQESSNAHPFVKPEGAGLGAWEGGTPKDAKPALEQTKPETSQNVTAPEKKQQATGPQYEYLFQTAVFKSQKDAENLLKKYKAAQLRYQTKKSGKVIQVLVTMRGTQSEKNSFSQKLSSFGVGKPLLLSRKEITQAKTSKNKGAKK